MARAWTVVVACVWSVACASGGDKPQGGGTDAEDTDGLVADTDVADGDTDTALFAETGLFDTDAPTPTDTSQPADTDPPTAAGLAFGDLVLTELMIEPSTLDCDPVLTGQYIELKNATDHVVNLQGLVLRFGQASDAVAQDVRVQPGAYVVGRPDTTACPGFPPSFSADFTYAASVVLSAQGPSTTVQILTPQSITIDSVNVNPWALGGPSARFLSGHAAHLNAGAEDAASNDLPSNWCSADESLGTSLPVEDATFGTPGRAAQGCESVPTP